MFVFNLLFIFKSFIYSFFILQADSCLGFFNEQTQQWECEDNCLQNEGDEYCGETGL